MLNVTQFLLPSGGALRLWVYKAIMVLMSEEEIKMSTTDSIPGEDRAVTRCEVAWASASTLKEAHSALKTWVREHEYDAIIGIRFTVRPDVSGGGRAGTVDIHTDARWIAYGTCISYRR